MNNTVKLILGIALYAILNTVYIRYFDILGIIPNINIILVVLIGLNMGTEKGIAYGLYLGFLSDIMTGTSLGFNALIYMYIGYISGALAKKMYNENIFISALGVAFADIFYNVIIYFTNYAPKDYGFFKFSYKLLLPEIIYTLAIFLFVYTFVGYIKRRQRYKSYYRI